MPPSLMVLTLLFFILSDSVFAQNTGEQSVYSCTYEVASRGTSGSAAIEVRGNEIQKVSLENFFQGLPGKLGYRCTLEASRDDKETKWTSVSTGVEIEFSDTPTYGAGDSMLVTPNAEGFLIDLSNTRSSGRCGAGAELPEKITILKSTSKCDVKM